MIPLSASTALSAQWAGAGLGLAALACALPVPPLLPPSLAANRAGAHSRSRRPSERARGGALWLLAVAVLGGIGMGWAHPSGVIAAALIVATAGWVLREGWCRRHRQAQDACLSQFLGTLTAELRAGATFPGAMLHAAQQLESGPAPLRAHLLAAAHVARTGGEVSAVLRAGALSAAEPTPGQETPLQHFASIVDVGQRYGIPLAQVCEHAQQRLDAQRRHDQATRSRLQGPQSTAVVLTCLPAVGIGMGALLGAHPLGFLLGGGLGGIALVVGTALVCAGFVWTRLLLRKAVAL
ncbi:type II secretion system F family protein [Corynebacterium lizhenjunii]|uniref:Type II secretion system F family protein n=1 Tax=Corynebacterium lizhenjunii TaxID=2709394 RepID=A0A7T0KFE5_9CORY|nr:type II secretion system F family protein [Corynebacterium lizhenjunii]QPK79346.1 type II secretion system F family protein [Corynebacterium lizhenjunii]